jgi:DNA repair exonuclease SbcCD nuclease subunit
VRLIITGDWQACVTNLDRLRRHVDQVVKILETSNDPSTFFVHLGDAKEHFNPLDVRVTNFLIESFTRIKKTCRGFWFIRGNHDSITTQDGTPSICTLVRSLGALDVADSELVHTRLPLLTWGGKNNLDLYFVPYFRDMKTQKAEFTKAGEHRMQHKHDSTHGLLFFHNTLTGARLNAAGAKVTALTRDDICADLYDACISGHVHVPQVIKNVTWVGSPFSMDWGEVNLAHRILDISIKETRK